VIGNHGNSDIWLVKQDRQGMFYGKNVMAARQMNHSRIPMEISNGLLTEKF
jgi:hypothetical protein